MHPRASSCFCRTAEHSGGGIALHTRQGLLSFGGPHFSAHAIRLQSWCWLGSKLDCGAMAGACTCVHECVCSGMCACVCVCTRSSEALPDSFRPSTGAEASGHRPTCSLSTSRSATFSCPSPRPPSSSPAASISGGSSGRQVDVQGSLLLEGGGGLWWATPTVKGGLG